MRLALALLLSLWALPAHAQLLLGDTQHRDAFFDDPSPDRCHAAQGVAIHPGYFAPIGSLRRDVEIEAGLGANGDVIAGTLAGRVIPVRFNRYLSLLAGISTAAAHRQSLDTTIGSSPIFELGLTARSECDRWNVLGTISYAAPDLTPGTPHDWQTTIPSVLVDPWNALLYLPVAGAGGFLATFDARVRTDGDDVFGAFTFRFRAGTTQVGSQFGVLRGFTGALVFEAMLAVRRVCGVPINLALAARFTVDLSAFWPANAVGPMALTVPLRWSPDRAIAMEIWGGFAMFLVGTAADLPQPGGTYGLRLTTYVDL
jgi:hypothetical protein